MKTLFMALFAFSVFLLAGCGTSQTAASGSTKTTAAPERPFSSYNDLADALRTMGGLRVEGGGTTAKIYIRGTSTITLETQPLYVIDGNPIGHNYSMANSALNMGDITGIKVLRAAHETTIYGKEGANGVILITTKNPAKK